MSNDRVRVEKVNENDVDWYHAKSPKGIYEAYCKELTQYLTAEPRIDFPPGRAAIGRPFEVELVRIPPGHRLCPKHAHTAQWEYYIVLSGYGRMVIDDGGTELRPGDHVIQPPGWAHTVENSGEEDLVYYVIADNPSTEIVRYPDSEKWLVVPQGKLFRMVETTYFDGEE